MMAMSLVVLMIMLILGVSGLPAGMSQQTNLRSCSPSGTNRLGQLPNQQQGNRLLYPLQQQTNQTQQQQQTQQQNQQQNVVSLPGPSPTSSNTSGLAGMSPFSLPSSMAQTPGSVPTPNNNQFQQTVSNGPASLPLASPVGSNNTQQNQFNESLKNRLAPSPSPMSLQQQQQQNMQSNQQQNQVNNTNSAQAMPSRMDTTPVPTPHPPSTGPKSVNSSRGPSPAPATPMQSSPATASSLGNL